MEESIKCKRCSTVLKQVMVTNDCGHIACGECLTNSNGSCPVCSCWINQDKSTLLVDYGEFQSSRLKLRNLLKNHSKNALMVPTASFLNRVIVFAKTPKIDAKGETRLHVECRRGDLNKVRQLISEDVDINCQDHTGWTPLHEAVCHNHKHIVIELLKYGALVDVPGENFATPLHRAVQKDNFETASLLLEFGAFRHATDYFRLSPIDYATAYFREKVFENTVEEQHSVDPKLFAYLPLNVYCEDVDVDLIKDSELKLVTFNSLKQGVVKVVILGCPDNFEYHDVVLLALMQGALIATENWFETFFEEKKIYSNEIYIQGVNTKKSVLYNIYKKPKLFAGIKFYFIDTTNAAYKIGRTTAQELVLLGDGKLLKRAQSEGTAAEDVGYPYHVKSDSLAQCCNYIVYPDEKNKPPIVYNMKELQTRSLRWLLNCIVNYSIRDDFELSC